MLRRLCCFDGRILSRCRPSFNGLRSIHHVLSSGCRPEPSDLPPATAGDPAAGWMMLNSYAAIRMDESSVADPNTAADSRTSTGRLLRISIGRAAPPASSFIYYDWVDSTHVEDDEDDNHGATVDDNNDGDGENNGDDEEEDDEEEDDDDYEHMHINVMATHWDSAVLQIYYQSGFKDHFLYSAGTASRPWSLSRLPARDFLTKSEQDIATYRLDPIHPMVHRGNTVLLRRGENDLLVVNIMIMYDRDARRDVAEFCVLRHGTRRWELKEPVPIILDDEAAGKDHNEVQSGNTVIPVGDRFLCWANYESGFLLCDMADVDSPKVRYVPLPPEVCCSDDYYYDQDDDRKFSKNMGSTGDSTLRFVSVDPHCCCGSPCRSTCMRSRYAFTINTWTMNLGMDKQLTWVKDGEMDCEELWALPGYEGLPRANVQCPVVSLDKPNVICFLVTNYQISRYEDETIWMIQLNIKTKTLLSVVQFNSDPCRAYHHLPAKLHC